MFKRTPHSRLVHDVSHRVSGSRRRSQQMAVNGRKPEPGRSLADLHPDIEDSPFETL